MDITFSVVGLGKLGASMAASIASRGFKVIGVDVSQRAVELVNSGQAPVQETNLEETIAANRDRFRATLSHREAILNSDVSFVVVPTPSDDRGAFSLQYAAWAFREIGRTLKEKDGYHNVVVTSTVLPGSTRYGLLPILEKESGKVCGKDIGLCYSPEFIALGSVIRDFLNPDFILIGEFDDRCGGQLEECYKQIMMNNPPVQRMSIENAELTNIAVNTFVTTKITFANMLADLCERIPGGDIDVVTNALGFDKRIGHKYLKGALGYGGPCFPRDNLALSFIARALGSKAGLAEMTDSINRALPDKIIEHIRPLIRKGSTVAILGLSYKPFSHVVEESQAIYLAKVLSKIGARVIAYDPLAGEIARAELKDQAVILDSLEDCLAQAEVILIATPDPAFQRLTGKDFEGKNHRLTIVDCWRMHNKEVTGHPNIRYIPLGRSIDDQTNSSRMKELWNADALKEN